jgi:multidrug efflux pump subunit AcrA (membrane-fusion protein)
VRDARETDLLEVPAQVLGSASQRAEVMPAFRAQVVQVLVEPGQQVGAGAALFVVRMPEVLRAAGAYLAAELRISAYGQRRDQLQALRAEGLARLSDLAEVTALLAEAGAARREAQSVLLGAGVPPGDVGSLVDSGGKVTLRSPLAGVIVQVGASIGQLIEPGSAPLARILGTGENRVEARFPLLVLPALRYELLTVPGGPPIPLTLLRRAPGLDSRDGMAQTWFLPAREAGLLPGQTGRLRVRVESTAAEIAPLWIVPSAAVRLAAGQVTVLRRRDGIDHVTRITIAASTVGQTLVRAEPGAELQRGDSVALQLTQPSLGGSP